MALSILISWANSREMSLDWEGSISLDMVKGR